LARVLPRLAAHDADAAEALAAHVAKTFERLHELDATWLSKLPQSSSEATHAQDLLADLLSDKTRVASLASPLALELRCCALVAEGIADDAPGARLKRRLLRRGALKAVTSYLLDVAFAGEGAAELDKHSEGWARACARPALAPALAALRGLVEAHAEASAEARDAAAIATLEPRVSSRESGGETSSAERLPTYRRRLLPLLHALESVAHGGVGTLSENALETAAAADASGATRDELDALRLATRQVNARRAMEQRERTLRSMGMTRVSASPPGGSGSAFANTSARDPQTSLPLGGSPASLRLGTSPGEYIAVVASPSSMRGVELVADDDDDDDDDAPAPACRVCREGYASRPTELLGVYAYCVEIGASSSGDSGASGGMRWPPSQRREKTFSTVSHFNAIHFSCHDAARRADAALKTPKREWEGASLRNGETLANNLLPLAAGSHCRVQTDTVVAAAEQWWERLAEIGGASIATTSRRANAATSLATNESKRQTSFSTQDGYRLRVALADVAALLFRFATRADFASGARGGGRRSNARFVPALLALAAGELKRVSRTEASRADEDETLSCPTTRAARRAAPDAFRALQRMLSSSGVPLDDEIFDEDADADKTREEDFETHLPSALVLSLLVTDRETWAAARTNACAAAVAHAARFSDEDDKEDAKALFAAVKPALVLVGLVDRLHAALRPARRRSRDGGVAVGGGEAADAADASDEEEEDGAFPAAATLAGVSRALRLFGGAEADETFEEWLEEAEEAEDAMELFDVMECLADVLAPANGAPPASADAFVADTWFAAKTRKRKT
jgi:E3 ubiquitin-protein ligase UBR4